MNYRVIDMGNFIIHLSNVIHSLVNIKVYVINIHEDDMSFSVDDSCCYLFISHDSVSNICSIVRHVIEILNARGIDEIHHNIEFVVFNSNDEDFISKIVDDDYQYVMVHNKVSFVDKKIDDNNENCLVKDIDDDTSITFSSFVSKCDDFNQNTISESMNINEMNPLSQENIVNFTGNIVDNVQNDLSSYSDTDENRLDNTFFHSDEEQKSNYQELDTFFNDSDFEVSEFSDDSGLNPSSQMQEQVLNFEIPSELSSSDFLSFHNDEKKVDDSYSDETIQKEKIFTLDRRKNDGLISLFEVIFIILLLSLAASILYLER